MTPAGDPAPVLLFDGYCNLCSGLVTWLLRRDRRRRLRFASLDSPAAAGLLKRCGDALAPDASLVLVDNDRCLTHSTAVLASLSSLGGLWRLAGVLLLLPRPLRDAVYCLVARHRYRGFGQRSKPYVPDAGAADRFLHDPPS